MFAASGSAILDSYVIHHRKVPGFEPPYAIAVVKLAEGPRMMTNIVECPQTPEALQLDMPLEVVFAKQNDTDHAALLPSGERLNRCHTTQSPSSAPRRPPKLGVIPDMSQIQLHADAALNAMADCGLKPKDIDGVATAGETPVQIAHYLGITPTWVDGTVGRRLLVHDPRPPCRGGDRGRAGEDHPGHAWRKRPFARRQSAAPGARRPA